MDVFRLFCRAKMPLIYFNHRCILSFAFEIIGGWPLDWPFAGTAGSVALSRRHDAIGR
jgi:hypothetical protein